MMTVKQGDRKTRRDSDIQASRSITRDLQLKMPLVQVACFTLCWAPYAFHDTWIVLTGTPLVSPIVSDFMLLTAVFNSCLNPLIYGAYFYKDLKTCGRRSRPESRRSRTETLRKWSWKNKDNRGNSDTGIPLEDRFSPL